MSSDNTIKIFRTGQVGSLCTVRVSETTTALKGELDVFIQAAEGAFFERITAQRPDIFVDYKNPSEINACTWHGNYVNSGGGIAGPKIHLKKDDKKVSWTSLDGVIEQKNIFMFPVFSLQIPHTFSAKPRKHRGSRGAAQTLSLKKEDVRIDFFLLPKHVRKDQFEQLTVATMALYYDITIYNRQMRGVALPLDNCEVDLCWFKLGSWWSVVRCVYPQIVSVKQYWIYFHDTFDPIACILNRGYSPDISSDEAEGIGTIQSQKLSFRDLHEKELTDLGLKVTCRQES
jgi:hypothetical protein